MKKIAFIMNNMTSGGVQVSLINLLKQMSKKKVEISLILTSASGEYISDVPKNIKVYQLFDDSFIQNNNIIFYNRISLKDNFTILISKIYHKIINKFNKQHINEYALKKTKKINENYDYIIDYLGYGSFCTYYALFGIQGGKRITFIHDEKVDWIKELKGMYPLFDNIFCVSNSCKKIIDNIFPIYSSKTKVCRNLIDKEKIYSLSKEDCEINDKQLNILTIGRLEYQKGYDLLIDTAKLLNDNKKNFKWYIIGDGSLYQEIKNKINKNNLNGKVILLGMQKNPYKYMRKVDIYAQTSRHEGYGIAIAEARALCKPIISTDIDCVREQINDGENGIISKYDCTEFYKKIVDLSNDKKMRDKLVNKLKEDKCKEIVDLEALLDID